MQTFIVKVADDRLSARDIRRAIWLSFDLGSEEIIVTEE